MAIFSLNHSFIGRTTHAAGSASLFARYVTRPDACTEAIGQRMPTERGPLMAWLDEQEQGDRKNARVIDKVVLALPLELTHEQNAALLQDFGERMTEGRASWMAGIHDGPGDADNPHAHMIFRDRDIETGKRVMLTTEQGSTQRFRDAWEQEANIALERAGFDERIDKRSLKDQGIEREPQLHVGAGAEKLREKDHAFQSAEREITRLIDGVPTTVTVNYPLIDEGKSRFEENEERKQRNLDRELAMDGIAAAGNRLEALYANAQQGQKPPSNDSDPLATMVAEHLEDRDKEAIERDARFDEPELARGGDDPHEKGPRRGPADLVGGAGLALAAKISEVLESFFDTPTRGDDERERPVAAREEFQKPNVTEQQQRQQEEEIAKWRKIEMELYLRQRDRERHIDRGR